MIKKISNIYLISSIILLLFVVFVVKYIYYQAPSKSGKNSQFFLKNINQDEAINNIKKIKIAFNGENITLLKNHESQWEVVEKYNYPASEPKVKELVFDLANLKIIEAKTSKAENFAMLNVEDVSVNKNTTSIALLNQNDQEIDSIYIGQREFVASKNADAQFHIFVRKPKENQVWLVAGKLSESLSFKDLVKQPIFAVDLDNFLQLELKKTSFSSRGVIKIVKDPTTKELKLLEVPPRYKVKEQYIIDNIVQQFRYLNYDDVILNNSNAEAILQGNIVINTNENTPNTIEFNLVYLNKNYYLKLKDTNDWLYKISDYACQSILVNKNDLLIEIPKSTVKPTKQ